MAINGATIAADRAQDLVDEEFVRGEEMPLTPLSWLEQQWDALEVAEESLIFTGNLEKPDSTNKLIRELEKALTHIRKARAYVAVGLNRARKA